MNLKWFVTFIAINVVSCMKSIQKIPPKYNTPSSNPDLTLTLPSDKNSFPDVVYPTSILDIANPFYFNTDDNYEVLGPFSEDVKSSYKLLSSITKPAHNNYERNLKHQMEINEVITTPVTDAVRNGSVKENITEELHNDSKEAYVSSIVLDEAMEIENNTDLLLGNSLQNYDNNNVSLSQDVEIDSCSKIPLLVKIYIQVFKERSDKSEEVIGIENNLSFLDYEENTHLKEAAETYLGNKSSEEITSSSEEHYTELQEIKHSDFIKMLSVLLSDLLISTDNVTSEMWNTTLIEHESLEKNVLESVVNLTKSESFGLMESEFTDLIINTTNIDFESMLNFTEPFESLYSDEESIKDSKRDYFLDLLISLDSLCEHNNTVESVAESEYLTNNEYLRSENITII